MSFVDPFVQLVEHLSRRFWHRHEPAVVAQVVLRYWTQYRNGFSDFDDPELAERIGEVLTRMPPSRQPTPPRPGPTSPSPVPARYGGTRRPSRGPRPARDLASGHPPVAHRA